MTAAQHWRARRPPLHRELRRAQPSRWEGAHGSMSQCVQVSGTQHQVRPSVSISSAGGVQAWGWEEWGRWAGLATPSVPAVLAA